MEWFVSSSKDAQALAQAILKILESPKKRNVMGNRSRLHITKHFTLNQVADAYANIYHRVLSR